MTNTGAEPVTLEKVELGASGARLPVPILDQTWIIRHLDGGGYGAGMAMPPDGTWPDNEVLWELKEPLTGAMVAPDETVNIVLGVLSNGVPSAADWFETTYSEGQHSFTLRSNAGVTFSCDDEVKP